jgi:hypothetical protein
MELRKSLNHPIAEGYTACLDVSNKSSTLRSQPCPVSRSAATAKASGSTDAVVRRTGKAGFEELISEVANPRTDLAALPWNA